MTMVIAHSLVIGYWTLVISRTPWPGNLVSHFSRIPVNFLLGCRDPTARLTMQFIDVKSQYHRYQSEIDARMKQVPENGQFILGPAAVELAKELAHHGDG